MTFYTADPAEFHRVREIYPRHRAYLDEFAASGEVVMIGPFSDPADGRAMAIFRSRDAAARFVAADPFVLEGVVAEVELREWDPLEFAPVPVAPAAMPAAAMPAAAMPAAPVSLGEGVLPDRR